MLSGWGRPKLPALPGVVVVVLEVCRLTKNFAREIGG
jgi:hypothetical protein